MTSRILARATLVGAVCTLAACTKGGRSDYVRDGDTGAAAPATMTDASHPTTSADSNAAVSPNVKGPAVAGDKLGQRGAAAVPNTPAGGSAAAQAAGTRKP
jgi:hypothetical protein